MNLKLKSYNLQRGQSLFEVVLALGVVTAICVGIVSLTVSSIRNASFSKNKTLAGRYAQEATEWLRSQRDADFDVFKANAVGTRCLKDLVWTGGASCTATNNISGTILFRKVSFTTISPDGKTIIEADVVVYWNDAQGYHETRSATSFSDWRQR